MLDKYNVHAKSFRMARDQYVEQPLLKINLSNSSTQKGIRID